MKTVNKSSSAGFTNYNAGYGTETYNADYRVIL